jgi:DNA-binding Lrp family transcriptional regulator
MNVDSQDTEQLNPKHLEVLYCICKATERNISEENISIRDIAKSLNLSESEIISISKYLYAQDLIKIYSYRFDNYNLDEIDCPVSITPKGIAEVKNQVTQNNIDPTEYLLNSTRRLAAEQQKKRFQVLCCIYKSTGANTENYINLSDVTKDTHLSEGEVLSIATYLLEEKGFIACDSLFGLDPNCGPVWITPKGISEIESTKEPKNQVSQTLTVSPNPLFINEGRLQELKDISSRQSKFDCSKLIKLCEELNSSYSHENYYATAMLTRAIMDHVPPIFGVGIDNFQKVANNYSGTQSFKNAMKGLYSIQKNISDGYLHEHIRNTESLPNATQVNSSQAIDKLLEEIVKILKKSES